MHEWALLGVVAAALYVIECCAWIAVPCQACFRHPLHGRWRAVAATDLIGNDRGGVLLTSPMAFSGAVVQSGELPFAIDPDGVVNVPATARDAHDAEYIAFTDIKTVTAAMETVLVNGRAFIKAPSAVAAAECAAFLGTLASSTRRRDRDTLIRSTIASRVNVDDVAGRWQRFQAETRALRLASVVAIAWLFLIVPLAVWAVGPLASWLYLLAGLLACGATTATLCFRAHQRLFTAAAYDRWVHVVSMVLFPLAAFRACDRLSKDVMWRFEPAALVAAFCDPSCSAEVLRPLVFDLSRPEAAAENANAAACQSWHRELLRSHVARMLQGVTRDRFVTPVREDVSMAAFCPRCHTQYAAGRACCSACVDVPLEPFAA